MGLAAVFGLLTVGFVVLAATSERFFAIVWSRHHNLLSWYIRPLFLVPFCVFAFRRSWSGIMGTLLALATSMAWFPPPAVADEQVVRFLAMEREYLGGAWDAPKVMVSLLVPVILVTLGAAFWRHNFRLGMAALVAAAVGKVIWSVAFGGESGRAVIVPALVGLALCIVLIGVAYTRQFRRGA